MLCRLFSSSLAPWFPKKTVAKRRSRAGVSVEPLEMRTVPAALVDVSGAWAINGQATSIEQTGAAVTLTNEFGDSSLGVFVNNNTQIQATDWGNLLGTLSGNQILWANGSVWTDADLSVHPFLSGTWSIDGELTTVSQTGTSLSFTNENGDTSTGLLINGDTQVQATGWGNLTGTLADANTTINWANSSVWVKGEVVLTPPDLSGSYLIGVQSTAVVQSGTNLIFINEFGDTSSGTFLSETEVRADDWGITGTIVNGDIQWSNETLWTAAVVSAPVDLAGDWEIGGLPTRIEVDGSNLLLTNEHGDEVTATFVSDTQIIVPAWGDLTATISADGNTLTFANASVWTRVEDAQPASNTLLTLELKPLDLDLLGLRVATDPITVTVSTAGGDGKLLGNLLDTVTTLIDVDQVNAALNNVLASTVDLLNSLGLEVAGVGEGDLSNAPASTTPILQLTVAPVHVDLLGVQIDTSPIHLSITATSGNGLVLGNVLTALTDLLNPPLPDQVDLAFINTRLEELLTSLNQIIPDIPAATVEPTVLENGEFLSLSVPAIDLNLLGLVLETTPITVDAAATTGDGLLLGNVVQTILNTLDATPEELNSLSTNINNLLAKVVGVLNAATLTLPDGALDPLSEALQTLALPDLIAAAPGSSAPILDLTIASTDGTTPPVFVDLLGVTITTSDIDAQLSAVTGEGQVLGNLLYNLANLMNPGGPIGLISLITDLATGSSTAGDLSSLPPASPSDPLAASEVLTLIIPPLDLDLLGLQVTSDQITVTITAQPGDAKLLGNLLSSITTLVNTQGVSDALNNVLASTVNLANSVDLSVTGVLDGAFSTGTASTTPILELIVAPIHLDLLGVVVDTGPIHLNVTAESGEGLVLGNVLTALTDLFNPPLPDQLDLAFINDRLEELLQDLNTQIPGIIVDVPPPIFEEGDILELTVPALDVNLLGLVLETSPITVNAAATTGDGLLVGNLLQTLLNTIDASPEELARLSGNVNGLLAKVVGVLNAATLSLPGDVLGTLSPALQTLALPSLIATAPGSSVAILDLSVTSVDGTTPPVDANILGLQVTTSDIDLSLSAQTGEGQLLGNLVYNVANLLNPDSPASLLFLLLQLGI